ncbi:hypothetical protein [Nocardia kruczakiae]|uniref:hypothetical protein n=1 Tax=Nocardia kruczakiae TaxID=261477 RepID=UPI0007A43459|nr:hypothetical protein [Nocardia kruczakiae]
MGSREIAVTVDEQDWSALCQAAEAAGMSVAAYVSWGVQILAMRARPGTSGRREIPSAPPRSRDDDLAEESAGAVWEETFTQRLAHRGDRLHDTEI